MDIYTALIIILSLFSLVKKNKAMFILSYVSLLIIGGFRALSVGTDTLNYYELYKYGDNIFDYVKGYEFLFTYLIYSCWKYVDNYQVFIILTMLLSLSPIFWVAKKESKNPILTILLYVLLYFWFFSFNAIRQSIAMSFCLMGIVSLMKNKNIEFFLLLLLGVFFHSSSIVVVVFYFIRNINVDRSLLMFIVIFSFIIGLLPISSYIERLLPSGLIYINYFQEVKAETFSLTRLLLTFFCCYIIYKCKSENLLLKSFVLGVMLMNVLAFSPVVARIAQYFLISQILLIPNIPLLNDTKKNRIIIKGISLAYAYVSFFYLLSNNVSDVKPYIFMLEKI